MSETDTDNFQLKSLNALFEHATEGIIISDENGTILKSNPSSENLFGYPPGSLVGTGIDDLVPLYCKKKHGSQRRDFIEKPHVRAMGKGFSVFGLRRDGSEFPIEVSLSYYREDEDIFIISFIVDITERHQQEQRIIDLNQKLEKKVEERTKVLREALEELGRSKEQLSAALDSQRELTDMKSRFVTMASHEFRTPLSTILSSISLVDKYNVGTNAGSIRRHVQRIKSAVTNMTLILNDFLSAEKLESGKVHLHREEVLIARLVEDVTAEIQGIMKPGQQIDYIHAGAPGIYTDMQMMRNILLNLFSNAIKFSPAERTIRVSTVNDAEILKIEVCDQGLGIPPEEQIHLFERFFRAKNVINIEGTGLGLNIVKKYLDTLEGKIAFKSRLNEGTCFYIAVPNLRDENNTDY